MTLKNGKDLGVGEYSIPPTEDVQTRRGLSKLKAKIPGEISQEG